MASTERMVAPDNPTAEPITPDGGNPNTPSDTFEPDTQVTMATDWGAKGAQLTGAQVQAFIKGQLQSLHEKNSLLQNQINSLNTDLGNDNPLFRAVTDGCGIVYHDSAEGNEHVVPYWEWPALEEAGQVATGVALVLENNQRIIIAPTEKALKWSKNTFATNSAIINPDAAKSDYNGKTNTAAIIAKGTYHFGNDQDEWTQYAPAWCHAYSQERYSDGTGGAGEYVGLGAGSWYLPSIGELYSIFKRKNAINLCLSVISGATLLAVDHTYYCSSTEYGEQMAYRLSFDSGILSTYSKTFDSMQKTIARPISQASL